MNTDDCRSTFQAVQDRAASLDLGATLELTRKEKQSLRGLTVPDLTKYGYDETLCDAVVGAIFQWDDFLPLFRMMGVRYEIVVSTRST